MLNKKKDMLEKDQAKFDSDYAENQARLKEKVAISQKQIAENEQNIKTLQDRIAANEEQLSAPDFDLKSPVAIELRSINDKARQTIDDLESANNSLTNKLDEAKEIQDSSAALYEKVNAQNRIQFFDEQSKILCENFIDALENNVEKVKIANQRKLKDMIAELDRIKTMLDKDNDTKYEALSSTDQQLICDLHEIILNGTEVRDIKEKLENLDLKQLSQLISNIENEYKQQLCNLRKDGESIFEFEIFTGITL